MLAKQNRLVLKKDFALTLKKGKRFSNKNFQLLFLSQNKNTDTKFGLIISKKVGNSVIRHKVSRKIRHIFLENIESFSGIDFVLLRGFPSIKDIDFHQLQSEILNFKNKYRLWNEK